MSQAGRQARVSVDRPRTHARQRERLDLTPGHAVARPSLSTSPSHPFNTRARTHSSPSPPPRRQRTTTYGSSASCGGAPRSGRPPTRALALPSSHPPLPKRARPRRARGRPWTRRRSGTAASWDSSAPRSWRRGSSWAGRASCPTPGMPGSPTRCTLLFPRPSACSCCVPPRTACGSPSRGMAGWGRE